MASPSAGLLFPLVSAAVSAAVTAWSIRYAQRRRLLDLPGQRRSHRVPTPRGGGIGIMVAVLACLGLAAIVAFDADTRALAAGLGVAVLLVGAVGWIDDHGGLAARWRFAAHLLAALLLCAVPLLHIGTPSGAAMLATDFSSAWLWFAGAAVCVLIVWSINLHNFMDGIDGLLAAQAIFVFAVAAALFIAAGHAYAGIAAGVCLAAAAGFLPFNFPRARVFMGDVGSGVVGLLVAVVVLVQWGTPRIALASGAIACSAFVTDATCTLLSRMLRGRRWYSAHREHLYQWLVRSGFSHARVVAFYLSWNVLIALPLICWINRAIDRPGVRADGIGAAALVYAFAVVVWWQGKQWCLRRVQAGSRR